MKLKQLTCMAFLVITPLTGLALAEAPAMFETTVERHQGPPLWISAAAVADSDKVINLELLDSLPLTNNIERQRKGLKAKVELLQTGEKPQIEDIPAAQCGSELAVIDHRGGELPSSTLEELSSYSQSIILGTITAIERGFSSGAPSSLLEVQIKEVLKGRVPGSRIYVDYLVARFRIGPYHFCNASKGFEPSPGDEILLFDYVGPEDRTGTFYAPRFEQIVFQKPGGNLLLSPKLKDDPVLNIKVLDQLIAKLRSKPERGKGA